MNDGYAKLAATLDRRTESVAKPKHDSMELGIIQADGSLLADGFPRPFPMGQYLRCRAAELLEPGARVLIAWTNGGTDPVIVDEVIT